MVVDVYLGKLGNEQKIGEITAEELTQLGWMLPTKGDLFCFGDGNDAEVLVVEQVLLDYCHYSDEEYEPTYSVFCKPYLWE